MYKPRGHLRFSCYASLNSLLGSPVLAELRLENYAVIDTVAVEFGPGLNLLTGETGAGKSILLDALALLLGEKASTEIIRSGAERAVISAVFELEDGAGKAAVGLLRENGIDLEEESLILRREIGLGGKGRVFINHQPATVGVLRQLAPLLATIHAQSESIVSFDGPGRLALLDRYAGTDPDGTGRAFAGWKSIASRIRELELDADGRRRLLDLWRFQREEIAEAKLQPGEDERLEAEKRILANTEKIYAAAMNAFDLLYQGPASASSSLRAAQKHIAELARYEPKFEEARAAIESARISVEDVGGTLRSYAEGIPASPERLAQVEDRLARCDRLKRKYGPTLADVIRVGEEVGGKLSEMDNQEEVVGRLEQELAQAAEDYLQAARAVSRERCQAARKLERAVEAEINELAMPAKFQIELSGSDAETNWTARGFDQVAYRISPNPGEPMRPLEQIASGGELSRVLLALRTAVEARGGRSKKSEGGWPAASAPRTLVFDEIDAGIGGRAAEAVGRKLKELSRANQVLCVTHLPQIAAFADHHYLIEKRTSGQRTRTNVRRISHEERTEEIARMLSGAKLTETSRKHAEQMLKTNQ
ncbi:MAG TPA: DNA repair protein RecN [Terriglobales bacterium]|nr:DNA repair protein RecN [Terriglobales bacterium]